MGLRDVLRNGLVLRKLLQESERQSLALARIAAVLEKIADQVAPTVPEATAADLKQTDISYSRDAEQVAIQSFCDKTEKVLGRPPTDEEIMEFLVERQ